MQNNSEVLVVTLTVPNLVHLAKTSPELHGSHNHFCSTFDRYS